MYYIIVLRDRHIFLSLPIIRRKVCASGPFFKYQLSRGHIMKKKPDIIIINPDEMRWDTMGHMGNPAASTPNLDAFALNEAVSFENAYCQNPVCVPSRCSFFTGLYPHVNGHRKMH